MSSDGHKEAPWKKFWLTVAAGVVTGVIMLAIQAARGDEAKAPAVTVEQTIAPTSSADPASVAAPPASTAATTSTPDPSATTSTTSSVAGTADTLVAPDPDEIPGVPLAFGERVSGVVDKTSREFAVYSIALTAGQKIKATGTSGVRNNIYVYVLPPDASSIAAAASDPLAYSYGFPSFEVEFTPATSGTHYVAVSTEVHGAPYELIVNTIG